MSELEYYKSILIHIATMDCLTRDGEKPAHELMKEMAQEAINRYKEKPNGQLEINWEKQSDRPEKE